MVYNKLNTDAVNNCIIEVSITENNGIFNYKCF